MYRLFRGIIALLLGVPGVARFVISLCDYLSFRSLKDALEPGEVIPTVMVLPPNFWDYACLILGLVLIVWGILDCIAGVKQLIVDTKTSLKGKELFGIVAETKGAMGSSNGSPFQMADIGVLFPDNSIRHFRTALKLGEQYDIGDFVHVKQYEDDINVLRLAETMEVPADTQRCLKYYPKFWNSGYVGDYFISGHAIEGLATMKVNDKRHNVQFDYSDEADKGFYEGDSGMFYKGDAESQEE